MTGFQQPLRVMPVSLLAEGRACLVVGAGRIAQRKIGHLLDSGATVTVVSPEPARAVRELAEEGRLALHARPFEPSDVEDQFIVFAATNDPGVNRLVRDACRTLSILCCAVDGSWRDGDFVTPAVVRRGELSVAISTAGQSCRRSRLVKESLSRHLDTVDHADLMVIGTSHACLSVAEREPYHLVDGPRDAMGRMLLQIWGVHEFAIVNTCNRVELHLVAADHQRTRELIERLMGFDRLPAGAYYAKYGEEAFQHGALLTAGLLSQTPGENHIVSQIKDCVELACDRGWGAGMIKGWLSATLHMSKHIRARTQPLLRDFELEDLAMDFLDAERSVQKGASVLVLGTGLIGKGLVERTLERFQETSVTWCFHQNRPELPEAWRSRVRLLPLTDIASCLCDVAIVLCATSSPDYVVSGEDAQHLPEGRGVTFIDMSMPRNVSPELNDPDRDVSVIDLDDLKHWYRREAADMAAIMQQAAEVVADHREMYDKLTSSFQGGNAQ